MRRAIAPSDKRDFATRVNEYTVWIPDGGENDHLGTYLLAIAYSGQDRIATGELFDFHVTTEREVYVYDVALEDYQSANFEEWGRPTADCLRYERERDSQMSVVSIVRDDDSDCDAFPDRSDAGETDCEPLLYCDGGGGGDCVGKTLCVHGEDSCSIGACTNKDGASVTCGTETCVSDLLCSKCDLTRSPAEILECALLSTETHPAQDMQIPTQGDQDLCSDPTVIDITLPFPCTNPSIDAISYYMQSDPFEFAIATGAMPNVCRLSISPTTDTRFRGVPHLLVSVDVPPERTGFVLGMISAGGPCPSNSEPIVRQYAPNIGTCPKPRL